MHHFSNIFFGDGTFYRTVLWNTFWNSQYQVIPLIWGQMCTGDQDSFRLMSLIWGQLMKIRHDGSIETSSKVGLHL